MGENSGSKRYGTSSGTSKYNSKSSPRQSSGPTSGYTGGNQSYDTWNAQPPMAVRRNCCCCPCECPPQLVNVDAMEELCYFVRNRDEEDECFQVCECCGVVTRCANCGEDKCSCTPVKYARRQRFTFNDGRAPPTCCVPPWPFHSECISCPSPCCGPGGGGGSYLGSCGPCNSGSDNKQYCMGRGCNPCEGLPNKSGVYYFNKTKNKLIFQTRKDTKFGCCAEGHAEDENENKQDECGADDPNFRPPVVFQPYIAPPDGYPPQGVGCRANLGNSGCGCNPCGCSPCGCSPCGCNPCGCGNPCASNSCGCGCNPCGCNPCGCGCNPCCNPCCPPIMIFPPTPAPPPPRTPQNTVIPMCIPIGPGPPPCGPLPPPPCG